MKLVNISWRDVAEQAAKLNEQGLRRKREDREMSDLARLNPLADLSRELPRKILPLERPELWLMILVGASAQLDVDRAAASSGIVIGEHRRTDLFIGDRRLVPADIGGVAQNVGSAILIDRGNSLGAALMPPFMARRRSSVC